MHERVVAARMWFYWAACLGWLFVFLMILFFVRNARAGDTLKNEKEEAARKLGGRADFCLRRRYMSFQLF